MSAPPTTRASRSRYSSPAVGGGGGAAGARNDGSSRGKGADKDKVRGSSSSNAAAASPAGRASSTERSRRFMENWIEPERVRLPSFQEHGLIRQGVLETMEPLGTIPKPALIKKLTGIGKERSPTPSARGGKNKKIILTRKNAPSNVNSSAAGAAAAAASSSVPGLPELMSDLQSPSSSTVATPQLDTSPVSTPAPAILPEQPCAADVQNSSPTPTPKLEELKTPTILPLSDAASEQSPEQSPEPQPDLASQPPPSSPPVMWDNIHRDHLRPPASTSNPFLPDPIKESIEENASRHLPGTPQSVHSSASTYDSVTDEYIKRGTSIPSRSLFNMPYRRVAGIEGAGSASAVDADEDPMTAFARVQQHIPQPPLGPWYTDAELARIVKQKAVVKTAIECGVAEALKHRCYVDAYALRFAFIDHQDDPRFLLQTEAIYRQMATKEAAGEWARTLQPYKAQGDENQTALKYFVPEAETDKDFDGETHKPLPAPYAHLVSIDLSEVRNTRRRLATSSALEAQDHDNDNNMAQPHVGETLSHEAQAQPDEAEEPERVATPPRKRQKTQTKTRDSLQVREASTTSARAMDNVNGGQNVASPVLRETRAGSNISDVSSLSSARSITPVGELLVETAQAAQTSGDQASTKNMQDGEQGVQEVQRQLGQDGSVSEGVSGVAAGVDGSNTAEQATPPVQPIKGRRLPARKARDSLGPNAYLLYPVLPSDSDATANSNANPRQSRNHSHHSFNSANNSPTPDPMSLGKQNPPPQDHSAKDSASKNVNTSSSSFKPPKRSQRGMPDYAPAQQLDPTDDKVLMRMAAQKKTHERTEEARAKDDSYVRRESAKVDASSEVRPGSSSSSLSSVPEVEMEDAELEQINLKARAAMSAGARATRATKRTHDEVDGDDTPFSIDFGGEAGTDTGVPSRAVTPRPPKKQKKELRRFKQSPTKNKAGPSAAAGGVPTRAVNRSSPVMNGAPSNQEDNDDFCSFCGGSGNLVCCDGCNKAFHYMDHEPVVDPDEDAAWFCWDCNVKRDPSLVGEYEGPFGALMTNLDKRHAKAFVLPKKVREYFEGVRTGADGEYEEFVPPSKGKKKKDNEEDKKKDLDDLFQIVDKDNNPILCHSCFQSAKSSSGQRAIIPCSLCGLWWHLDCLDPPRAHPPNTKTWVCPCHVDNLLALVPAQLGPAHKFRKIKGASDIKYAFRRGNVNNGWIEVDDDLSEDEARRAQMGLRDPGSWGKKYILPGSGIRDDFIAVIGRPCMPEPAAETPYSEAGEEEYQAALNMLAFLRQKPFSDKGPTAIPDSGPVGPSIKGQSIPITSQSIQDANESELRSMQQQLRQLQAKISSELRTRDEENNSARGPSNTQKDKQAVPHESSDQQIEGVTQPGDDAEGTAVEGRATASNSGVVDVAAANDDEDPIEATKLSASLNGISLQRSTALRTPQLSGSNGFARPFSGEETMTEKHLERDPIVKSTVDRTVDQSVDAALTPPADMTKDDDGISTKLPTVKPTSNGAETPETIIADPATSPPEADAMDLDGYDHS